MNGLHGEGCSRPKCDARGEERALAVTPEEMNGCMELNDQQTVSKVRGKRS